MAALVESINEAQAERETAQAELDATPTPNTITEAEIHARIDSLGDIGAFAGLILVICLYEGGLLAVLVTLTVGLIGGLMNRMFGVHSGVQFMGYYAAVLTVPAIIAFG